MPGLSSQLDNNSDVAPAEGSLRIVEKNSCCPDLSPEMTANMPTHEIQHTSRVKRLTNRLKKFFRTGHKLAIAELNGLV